jgi:hypothetical protein
MMSAELHSNANNAPSSRLAPPSTQELEDVLYDILAAGVDPTAAPGALEAIQCLLHEHARAPKSQLELLAFFEAHGLSTRRLASPTDASFGLPAIEFSELDAGPDAIGGMAFDPSRLPTAAPARRSVAVRWALVVAAAVVVGLGVAAGYGVLQSLQGELARVRAEAADQQQAMAKVRAEAQSLRATVAETSTLAERAHQNSELLLQTYASPVDLGAR